MGGEAEATGVIQKISNSFEYEALLEKFNVSETQLSRGETHVESVVALFPHIVYGTRKSSSSCQLEGAIQEPQINFFFPVNKHPRFISEAIFDSEGSCFIFHGDQFRVVFPTNYEHDFLGIKTRYLDLFFNDTDIEKFNESIRIMEKKLCHISKREKFLQDLKMSTDIFRNSQEVLKNRLVVKDITARLIYSLYECICSYAQNDNTIRTHKIKPGLRYNIIRRTLRIIETQDISKLSIADVAKAACVSIRTLEYAFTSVLNMTPKQYLVTLRLNAIRRELIDSRNGTTIKSILTKYGVVNQGRFSCDYCKLFGELPSETKQDKKL